MCEFLRAGYTTLLRPFRDSIETVKIRWYRALPNAPCLGFPSAITSLNWDDTPWRDRSVGEVYGATRPFSPGSQIPLATGAHVCGTPQDFALGEHFDPDLPPTIYAQSGLPVCCHNPPERASDGGAAAGGTAGVGVTYATTSSGGAAAGGTAGVGVTYATTSSGGAVTGGTAGVSVITPGTCDTYTVDPPFFGYDTFTRVMPGDDQWYPGPGTGMLIDGPAFLGVLGLWFLFNQFTGESWIATGWAGRGTQTFVPDAGGASGTFDVTCAD